MKILKILMVLSVSFFLVSPMLYANVIIWEDPSGLSKGISTAGSALGQALRQRSLLRQQQMMQQAERDRQQQAVSIEKRDAAYIASMLRDYESDRHIEYVNCIKRSALSKGDKALVVFEFENKLLEYKKTLKNDN